MDDRYVQAIYGLFVNRVDCFLAADPRANTWYCRKEALTIPLIQAAVHGRMSLGLYAVSGIGTSKWVCVDGDSAADLPVLYQLAARLAAGGNILLEQSRRGGHLWIFGPPTPWQQVQAYGQQLVAEAGLGAVEIYPKYEGLHGVKLPGSVHPRSHRVYPAINPLTGEVMDVRTALLGITPQPFPELELRRELPTAHMQTAVQMANGDFWDLIQELSKLTKVRVYAEGKASACCPWHRDVHPSLYIKDRRMHCLSPKCRIYGDAADVRRFLATGVRPPQG